MTLRLKPRPRWTYLLAIGLFLLAIVLIAMWVLFPWGPIRGLAVEETRILQPKPDEVSRTNGQSARQIAVTFSSPVSIEDFRQKKGAGFINATLSVCQDADRQSSEVVTQRAGYFADNGRVREIPSTPGVTSQLRRYRAIFDDPRDVAVASKTDSSATVALPEDLCFSLDGGSMWAGKLWSQRIRLKPIAATR